MGKKGGGGEVEMETHFQDIMKVEESTTCIYMLERGG